jgi:competence protein ComEA
MNPRSARQRWWLLALGLIAAVITAGLAAFTVRQVSRPRPVEIVLVPAEAGSPVEVYLGGAVDQEGIYSVGQDATLEDILQRAGVALPAEAALRIKVSVLGPGDDPSSETTGEDQPGRINVNTAAAQELESLPGIGPTKAQAIVDYRDQNGPFRIIDDLLNVPGIGARTLEDIRGRITVIG